jgi:hypothetical protein
MARTSGNASNSRKVGRPAQGNNSGPMNRPRPAYLKPFAPTVVSQGSVSKPRDTKWAKGTLKTLRGDTPPKIVKL